MKKAQLIIALCCISFTLVGCDTTTHKTTTTKETTRDATTPSSTTTTETQRDVNR